MDKLERYRKTADILLALEAELRQRQLWASEPPSAEKLRSTMPFMYDTLKLHEWLQFVFLPRTQQVIESGGVLPGNCHIFPLAEHEFAKLDIEHDKLLDLVRQMDNVLNMP